MWKEFIDPFCPFNPMKVLAQREQIESVLGWMNKENELPPPLSVVVDPTNLCNVNCFWCNRRLYREKNATSIQDGKLLELGMFLQEWGVKGVILSGGEPLLHPKIVPFLEMLGGSNIDIGLKTNGSNLDKVIIREAVRKTCSWVGVSLDAAEPDTYLKVKKTHTLTFDSVLRGVKALMDERGDTKVPHVTLKFLIHHQTYKEVYAFVDKAKSLGVDAAELRPLFLPKYKFTRGVRKTAEFYLREARKAFESDDFHIYAIVGKFEREWDRAIKFRRCLASALSGCFGADGTFHLCADRRGDKEVALGPWYPFDNFKKLWGSDRHRDLLGKVFPQTCPKCSMAQTNEIIERCVELDSMGLNFV
jgi:MoaA/NifB/PqqE/SkfB family radical SAM enzyme